MFSPWVRYTVLRLGMFTALFVLFMLLSIVWWLSALLAAIISLCLSYIFLAEQRAAVAADIAARRAAPPGARGNDETAEDSALEGERGGETETEHERRQGGQP